MYPSTKSIFDVSQMVVKSGRKIRSKSVRQMLAWSHYKFEQHLKQVSREKRCIGSYLQRILHQWELVPVVAISIKIWVEARYTNAPYCGNVVNRDWGGAFNIML